MLRQLLAATVLACSLFGAEPVRDVVYVAPFYPHSPKFDKGYLLENPKREVLIVYGRDGGRAFATTLTAPHGVPGVLDAAVDQNGGFAVSLLYFNQQEFRRGAIAFLDQTGKQIRTVETGRFLPAQLCFAPTGELWALGEERSDEDWTLGRGLFLFRKYSPEGKEIGNYRHWARLTQWPTPGEIAGFGSVRLQIANDRVGAWGDAYHEEAEWIEIDFQGKLLGEWMAGRRFGIALTSKGELYSTDRDGIVKFDRSTSTWVAIKDCEPTPERYGRITQLLAADGDALVVMARDNGRLLWLAAP